MLAGSYDARIVALSVAIALVSAYATLDLAERVTAAADRRARVLWLGFGALAMGVGMWAMHFVGMLAFRLPMPVAYHWPLALLSLASGAVAALIALAVVVRPSQTGARVLIAGLFMAAGMTGMHYIAMASMRIAATFRYEPWLIALSVLFAIGFSLLAMTLTFMFRHAGDDQDLRKAAGALLMGAAVCAMHYSAMAAVTFTPTPWVDPADWADYSVSVSTLGALSIGAIVLTLLAIVVVTCVFNRMRAQQLRLERSLADVRALSARSHRVREDERAAVAREIHDELGQGLTSIKIDLSFLKTELPGANASTRIESLLVLTDEALRSVRRISTTLRPGLLDDLGAVAAIEWAAEEFAARTGIECHLVLPDDPPDLDADRATAIFRIFQEALTNITRHAFATRVDVRLAHEDDELVLEIRDNGVGIDQSSPPEGKSFGILGMRERAQLVGGHFSIRGGTGIGTIVTVRIPAAAAVGEPG